MTNNSTTNNRMKNIIILSEDHLGNGGYGTRAWRFYDYLTKYQLNVNKLIYFEKDQTIAINLTKQYNFIESIFIPDYYQYFDRIFNNQNDPSDLELLYHRIKTYFNQDCIIICLTPITLIIANRLKISYPDLGWFKIGYYNGSVYHKNLRRCQYQIEIYHHLDRLANDPCLMVKLFKDNLNQVDFIINNSELSYQYINQIVHRKLEPLILYPSTINQKNNNDNWNSNKKIDLIYIASDVNRRLKNSHLMLEIFQVFPHLNKTIIGQNASKLPFIDNTQYIEYLDNNQILDYLNDSKILIITSLLDLSPNIFFESIFNHCIPIISHNVGTSLINNSQYKYVVDFNLSNWVKMINSLLLDYNITEIEYQPYFNIIKQYFIQCEQHIASYLTKLSSV